MEPNKNKQGDPQAVPPEDKHANFAANLRRIRKEKGYTVVEYAQALDLPKSTLQAVLTDGNATLSTAIHISERLNMPLDVLLSSGPQPQDFNAARWLMEGSQVFRSLPPEQQDRLARCVNQILEILHQ